MIRSNIKKLNEIFISLISATQSYPFLSWLDYSSWIKQINIIDEEKLPMATFDRIFIATNIEEEDLQDNPDRALCRYEYLEILVRMAIAKYGTS
jgi:hypothetical protein